jgi:hypothetical protein
MSNAQQTASEATKQPFHYMYAGLVIFGCAGLLLGSIVLLLIPLMLLGKAVSPAGQITWSATIASALVYLVIGTWFIILGVGSIRARRWARTLSLATGWLILVGGAIGMTCMIFLMPAMQDAIEAGATTQGTPMPPGAFAMAMVISMGFSFVIYLILPTVVLFFYGNRNVKATCAHINPSTGWSDRCPIPVQTLAVMLGLWAFSYLLMFGYNCTIPFFGTVVSGVPGALVCAGTTAFLVAVVIGLCRMKPAAWWGAFLGVTAWCASALLTFGRVDLMEFYEEMEFPETQLAIIRSYNLPAHGMVGMMVFSATAALVFILYTRLFFKRPAAVVENTE